MTKRDSKESIHPRPSFLLRASFFFSKNAIFDAPKINLKFELVKKKGGYTCEKAKTETVTTFPFFYAIGKDNPIFAAGFAISKSTNRERHAIGRQ